ncbi:MAG: GGDEF domain-containing protein [Ilumatobacter sp.]|uniref:GGDEF domain-containing protein n=1 Tax=Ilumatobacter sp. TaxID=1967498 RepID=UPI00391BA993
MSAEVVLAHLRQTVLVIADDGTILQQMGSSFGTLDYEPGELVGNNALDYVAPAYYEAMLSAFFWPDDRRARSKHLPYKLGLLDRNGERHDAECCAERVRVDDGHVWIVTLMPHELESASTRALHAYGASASSLDVAASVARSLSMEWDDAFTIRSFLLADFDGHRFASATEPGRAIADDLGRLVASLAGVAVQWNRPVDAVHTVLRIDDLPGGLAEVAFASGLASADLAVAHLHGQPKLAVLSFAPMEYVFEGNIDVILRDSMQTIEMALRREESEQRLTHAAERDPLTGLVNRTRFAEALDTCTSSGSVLFIDLDDFKLVNDTFGHVVGDKVLVEVARRITEVCRPDDVVTRLGGDEFAVLLVEADTDAATSISERILAAIVAPLPVGLGPDRVSASAGLATSTSSPGNCVERADLAMLCGKRSGRGQLVVA